MATHTKEQPKRLQFPAWVEMPPYVKGDPQRCQVSGLPLTSLRCLVRPCSANSMKPPVISKIIKTPGTTRGRLMVNTESLLAWMDSNDVKEGER